MYSTGNYTEYPMINHNGKSMKKKSESLCYTVSICSTISIL